MPLFMLYPCMLHSCSCWTFRWLPQAQHLVVIKETWLRWGLFHPRVRQPKLRNVMQCSVLFLVYKRQIKIRFLITSQNLVFSRSTWTVRNWLSLPWGEIKFCCIMGNPASNKAAFTQTDLHMCANICIHANILMCANLSTWTSCIAKDVWVFLICSFYGGRKEVLTDYSNVWSFSP